jgi:hypothetical protein
MKCHVRQLSFILAALAFAPAALAGSEIVKCVDPAGHVTLTDQPCGGHATTVRVTPGVPASPAGVLAQDEPEADGELEGFADVAAAGHASRVERHGATPGLLGQANWKPPPAPQSKPLARDVATLKAARLQLLMMDSAAKRQPRLAGLD